jgi:hypothetical protein
VLQDLISITYLPLDDHVISEDSIGAVSMTSATFYGELVTDTVVTWPTEASYEVLLNGQVVQPSVVIGNSYLGTNQLTITPAQQLLSGTSGYQFRITAHHINDTKVFLSSVFSTDPMIGTTAHFLGSTLNTTKTGGSVDLRINVGNNTPIGYAEVSHVSGGAPVGTQVFQTPADATVTYNISNGEPGDVDTLILEAYDQDSIPVFQDSLPVTFQKLSALDIRVDSVGGIGPEEATVYCFVKSDTVSAWPTKITYQIFQGGNIVNNGNFLNSWLGDGQFSIPIVNLSPQLPYQIAVTVENVSHVDVAFATFTTTDYPTPPTLVVSVGTMSSDRNFLQIPISVTSSLPVTVAVTAVVHGNNIPFTNYDSTVVLSAVNSGSYVLDLGAFDPELEIDVLIEAWNHPARKVSQSVTLMTQPGSAPTINGSVKFVDDTSGRITFQNESGGWLCTRKIDWWEFGGSFYNTINYSSGRDFYTVDELLTGLTPGTTAYAEMILTSQRFGTVSKVLEFTTTETTVSVREVEKGFPFQVDLLRGSIYNPLERSLEVTLIDLGGKIVFSKQISAGESYFETGSLSSGLYAMRIYDSEQNELYVRKAYLAR